MGPLWGVLLRQWAEEPAQPTVGPEGPGLKWLLGLLGTSQKGFLVWFSQGPFSSLSLL